MKNKNCIKIVYKLYGYSVSSYEEYLIKLIGILFFFEVKLNIWFNFCNFIDIIQIT